MFFKLADTHANRHFLQNKRHRHVNDLFPGILIAWLDSNDQQAAELEGIELKRSSSPNDKLFAIEAKASNRVFLNELLGRQIAHDTESNEFHVLERRGVAPPPGRRYRVQASGRESHRQPAGVQQNCVGAGNALLRAPPLTS